MPVPSLGLCLQGAADLRYADRDEVYEAGDAYYTPPGHVPVRTAPGTEALQFSPTEEVRPTTEVIMKNVRAMQEASG